MNHLEELRQNGNTGADLSPGDPASKWAHDEIVRLHSALPKLRQAIIDNTKGDLFWIGEILLSELEKETGFRG